MSMVKVIVDAVAVLTCTQICVDALGLYKISYILLYLNAIICLCIYQHIHTY